MIQPDLKSMTVALLTSHGLNQGLTTIDTLATKLIEFLEQIKLFITNSYIFNCTNIAFIKKVIRLTSIKYGKDKGRQERAMCLILACLIGPSLKDENEKKLFASLLKKIFEFEATNFIEEILSVMIKNQLAEDRLTINNRQLQKMIDLYVGLKLNRSVILCGPPLDGKTTIWKTVSRAINSFESIESLNVRIKIRRIAKNLNLVSL
jgi:hypothetical protein